MNQKVMVSVRVDIPLNSNRGSANLTLHVAKTILCVVLLGLYEGHGVGVDEPDVDSLWDGGPGTRCIHQLSGEGVPT